ncbi:unnamed protein product [Sympodiomycopsis kandeliae]
MEATFSADNSKTLQTALICLAKLGESLNLQVTRVASSAPQASTAQERSASARQFETTVRLSAINSTSSAFCAFSFPQEFFDSIRLGNKREQSSNKNLKLECQVNIRSLLASLKTSSSGSSSTNGAGPSTTSGRKLERCELNITDGGVECRLTVKLHYQHGIVKTHKLTYESQQAVFPSANPDPNSFLVVSSQTVQEWLLHFISTGRNADISLWCNSNFCTVRSKSDDFDTSKFRKSIQTEVKVEIEQFQLYQVETEAFLTLPLKEFRAAVTVAEAFIAPVELHFSVGGEPLFIRIFGDIVSLEMVIATTDTKPPEMVNQQRATPFRPQPPRASFTPQRPAYSTTQQQSSTPPQPSPRLPSQPRPSQPSPRTASQAAPIPVAESQASMSGTPPIERPSQQPRESTPPLHTAAGRHDRPTEQRQSPPPLPEEPPAGSQSLTSLSQSLFRGGQLQSTQDEPCEFSEEQSHTRNAMPSSSMAPPPARKIVRPIARSRTEDPRQAGPADGNGDDLADEDTSFDYGGVLDEMEKGIRAGSIPVHGSQTSLQAEKSDPAALQAEKGEHAALQAEKGAPATERSKSLHLEALDEELLAGSPQEEAEEESMPSTQQNTRADGSVTMDESVNKNVKRFRPIFDW